MILDRGGFNAIPHIISYRDTTRAGNRFVRTANSWATFHDPALKKSPSLQTKQPPPLLLPIQQQLLLQQLRLQLQQQQRQKPTQTRKQGTTR